MIHSLQLDIVETIKVKITTTIAQQTNKQTNKQTKTKNKAKNKTKQNKSKEEHNLIILMTCIYNVYALSIFFAHLKKKTCVFFSQEFKVYFPIDVRVN